MSNEVIATENAPAAIGPYSQAIKANGFVFTAGQIPLDPATKTIVAGGIEEQSERVMQNLAAILEAAGSSLQSVVKTTCYLANMDDFAAFNAVYGRWFGECRPSRSTIQAVKLPLGVLVEVDCIAVADA
ncbi:MAG: 2-iminobutanoate/2-iminopropanoate deaminase [Thermomicrobiales bacterium]|jgi:2-iminobutanoate/2-iminopropanoate deaminase|nr:2-iminobutanoate/2-iminopropanoate deaminase [Thermomicrobiales bacterium]MEA2525948.1 2-iminobutanoate/2-iminopropanoate deaminase [Thermomicrobiales bacterium]MEA2583073.1 2-iminobutanoate/2-iminopropanoate deaminase [Thermomicrobiales bacterium]